MCLSYFTVLFPHYTTPQRASLPLHFFAQHHHKALRSWKQKQQHENNTSWTPQRASFTTTIFCSTSTESFKITKTKAVTWKQYIMNTIESQLLTNIPALHCRAPWSPKQKQQQEKIKGKTMGRKRRDNKKTLLKRQELAACKNTTCSPSLNNTRRSDNEWNETRVKQYHQMHNLQVLSVQHM